MIKIENLKKAYGNTVAVKDLNLHIRAGEFLVFIGPSGCGKTTSLKMINRLIEPTSGKIIINGQNIMDMNPVKLRREIGYVVQQIGLFPNMTIQQNVDLVPRLLGWDNDRREKRVRELLEMVNMDPDKYAHRYPNELSGGQQQRIGVLRALAAEPSIILMDEPFGALDPITRDNLQDELKKLQSKLHKTIVFVTHDMDEALKLADRIALMKDGELVQLDTPEMLLRKPANDFVLEFMGKHRPNDQELELVESIMNSNPVTINPEKGIAEAVALMKRKRVNTLLVVDDNDALLGMVTVEALRDRIKATKVGELTNHNIPSILAGSSAKEAFDLLISRQLDYIPVINESKKVLGLVTRTSMVTALADAVWGEEETA